MKKSFTMREMKKSFTMRLNIDNFKPNGRYLIQHNLNLALEDLTPEIFQKGVGEPYLFLSANNKDLFNSVYIDSMYALNDNTEYIITISEKNKPLLNPTDSKEPNLEFMKELLNEYKKENKSLNETIDSFELVVKKYQTKLDVSKQAKNTYETKCHILETSNSALIESEKILFNLVKKLSKQIDDLEKLNEREIDISENWD